MTFPCLRLFPTNKEGFVVSSPGRTSYFYWNACGCPTNLRKLLSNDIIFKKVAFFRLENGLIHSQIKKKTVNAQKYIPANMRLPQLCGLPLIVPFSALYLQQYIVVVATMIYS